MHQAPPDDQRQPPVSRRSGDYGDQDMLGIALAVVGAAGYVFLTQS